MGHALRLERGSGPRLTEVNEILTWLLDVVQNVDPVLRTIIAGIAVMLETSVLVGLVVPGDTMVIVAGTAVASPVEGVVLAAAIVVGALLGESLGFWLGRYFGPRIAPRASARSSANATGSGPTGTSVVAADPRSSCRAFSPCCTRSFPSRSE